MRKIIFIIFLIFSFTSFSNENYKEKVKRDFQLIKDVFEMFFIDEGFYPKFNSIKEFKEEAIRRQYLEDLEIKDPFGNFYKIISNKGYYKVSTGDGKIFIEDGIRLSIEVEGKEEENRVFEAFKSYRTPDTVLYLTKEGDDIRLNFKWFRGII